MKSKLTALAIFLLSPVSAVADIDGSEPWRISQLMKDKGYQAQMDTNSAGNPMIRSSADGTKFLINFFGCGHSEGCGSIQFVTAFDLSNGMSISSMNEWNKTKRFGKVYLDDENDPFVELDVNLRYGVSDENFFDTFDFWLLVMREFRDYAK